jgi:hypothetical protein
LLFFADLDSAIREALPNFEHSTFYFRCHNSGVVVRGNGREFLTGMQLYLVVVPDGLELAALVLEQTEVLFDWHVLLDGGRLYLGASDAAFGEVNVLGIDLDCDGGLVAMLRRLSRCGV